MLVPEQDPPLHPLKVKPVEGVAVRVMEVWGEVAKLAVQEPELVGPTVGFPLIVPDPIVERFNVVFNENCAVTIVFALIVNAHVSELEVHVPAFAVEPEMLHPVKVELLDAVRVRVTDDALS